MLVFVNSGSKFPFKPIALGSGLRDYILYVSSHAGVDKAWSIVRGIAI